MIVSFIYFLKQHYRDRYPTLFGILGEFLNACLVLTVYWYTSRAFGNTLFAGATSDYQMNYFSFVLLGEIFISIPIALSVGASHILSSASFDETFEAFRLLPGRTQTPFILSTLALVPIEVLRALLKLLIAIYIFNTHFQLSHLLLASLFQIAAMPAFLGLGLIASALMMRLGRGAGIISQASALAAVLAGAYFPLGMFPTGVQKFATLVSPFTVLLQGVRQIFAGHGLEFSVLLQIFGWSAVLMIVGYGSFGLALGYIRKRGQPLIIP